MANIGQLPPVEEIIRRMVECVAYWKEVYDFVTGVMCRKEREDRER